MTESPAEPLPEDYLDRIQALLEHWEGRPIRAYKKSSLSRRLLLRQQLLGIEPEAYLRRLEQDANEARHLAGDLLVGVTAFFRDAEAFELLRKQVLPELVLQSEHLRVWVPACASGEEVYSLAILLDRQARRSGLESWQIFATDLDREAIARASQGRYPLTASLSEELRREYFDLDGEQLQVKSALRERIVFAVHDLLVDPPFGQMDLVSCRNLLIYLRPDFQQRLFQTFGYAVRPGGWLMLGPSETMPDNYGFEEYDHNWRLYRRRNGTQLRPPGPLAVGQRPEELALVQRPLAEQVQQQLLAAYVPRGMVFRENFELMHISGMEPYLRLPAGAATLNVLELLPAAWAVPLSLAVSSLLQQGQPVALQLPDQPPLGMVLELMPTLPGHRERLIHAHLDGRLPPAPLPETLNLSEQSQARLLQLERELRQHQEQLQTTVDELAGSNEELQATNEELYSTNEQLQSINADYHRKLDELGSTNDDLYNLLQSTEIATLFLDEQLCIRRFTQAIHEILPLLPQDIGRSLSHFRSNLLNHEVLAKVAEVARSGQPHERQLHDGQRDYMLRMHPFRSQSQDQKGVVLTFVDISPLMQTRRELEQTQEARERLVNLYNLLVTHMRDVIVLLDAAGRIEYLSPSIAELTGRDAAELTGQALTAFALAEDRPRLEAALAELGDSRRLEYRLARADGETVWVEADLRRIADSDSGARLLATLRGITKRKQAEAELYQSESRLRAIFENSHDAVMLFDRQLELQAFNTKARDWVRHRQGIALCAGLSLRELMPSERREQYLPQLERVFAGASLEYESGEPGPDGERWYAWNLNPVQSDDGSVSGVCINARDITERKLSELAIHQSESNLRAIFENIQDALMLVDQHQRLRAFNDKVANWSRRHDLSDPRVGDEVFLLARPDRQEAFRAQVQQVLDQGQVLSYEVSYLDAEGRQTWAQLTITPVREADGQVSGACIGSIDITERKRAELAIRQSETNLRAIFENVHEALLLIDRDLRIVAFNDKVANWTRAYGRPDPQIGEPLFALADNSQQSSYSGRLGEVLNQGIEISYESCHLDDQGQPGWYFITISPVREANGSISGACVSGIEITERKQAELALEESRGRLQAIFDSSQESFALLDRELRVQVFNPGITTWARLAELPPLEEGKSMLEILPEAMRADFAADAARVMNEGISIEVERCFDNSSEEPRWYLVTRSPVYDSDNAIIGLCISARDITERKLAELAVLESEARLQAIFQNVNDILILLDRQQRVIAYNAKAEDWTYRLDRPKISIGAMLPEIIAVEHSEAYHDQMRQVLDEGRSLVYDRQHIDENGRVYWYLVSLIPVREADGRITGVSISGRDVTDIKRSEQLLSELNTRLHKAQEIAALGYWDYSANLDQLSCSEQSCLIFGFSAAAHSFGLAELLERVHPDDREALQAAWSDLVAGRASLNLTHRLVVDGQIRHVRQLAQTAAEDPIQGSVQDISEWYQTEQELTQLFELSADLICICDLTGHFRKLNPAFEAVLGYRPDAETCLADLIHPQDAPLLRREFEKLGRGQGSLNVENRVRCSDGSWRWISWKASAMEDTGLVYCIGYDVTDRKQAEAQLAEYADRLTLILESITDAFVTLDSEGRFTYANQAAVRLLQLDEEKLVGNSLWALFPVDEGPIFADRYRWALIYQEPVHFEVFNQRLSAWLEVSVYPSEENFSVFFRDITEIKLSRGLSELERELLGRQASGRESLTELLDGALRQIQQLMPGARCLIQLPREGHLQTLTAPDLSPECLSVLSHQPLEDGHGTAVAALRTKQAVLAPNMLQDPAWQALHARLDRCDMAASWSWPVFTSDQDVLAVFSCFYQRIHQPRMAETLFAERLSKLLAQLLEHQPGEFQPESQQRWELLSRATQDAIWDWQAQTDRVSWNHQLQQLFGYAPAEVESSLNWRNERIHPADREQTLHSLEAAFSHHASHWQAEYRFRCADGSWKHVCDRASLLYDQSGALLRVLGTMEDVSERKRREQRLQNLSQRYEAACLATGGAIWDWQIETDSVEWNATLSLLGGYAPDAVGDSLDWLLETIHPDERARVRSSLQQSLSARERRWQASYRFRCADGSYRPVTCRAYLLLDEERPSRMIGVLHAG